MSRELIGDRIYLNAVSVETDWRGHGSHQASVHRGAVVDLVRELWAELSDDERLDLVEPQIDDNHHAAIVALTERLNSVTEECHALKLALRVALSVADEIDGWGAWNSDLAIAERIRMSEQISKLRRLCDADSTKEPAR